MKKYLFVLIATYLIFVACTYGAGAQGTKNLADFTQSKSFHTKLAFMIRYTDSIMTSNTVALTKANINAVKDFKSRFENVHNEKWYTIPGGFESYFQMDGFSDRAFYDKKGHWQSTMKVYDESKLPVEVRRMVRSEYLDYSVFGVHEISIPDNLVYIIYLEDKTSIKIIRVNQDFDMDVMQEFEKG